MHQHKLLALAIFSLAIVAVASCQRGDAESRKVREADGSLASPIERGAPGNPRGPTDPSR